MEKKHVWLAILVLLLVGMLYLLPAAAKEEAAAISDRLLKAVEDTGARVSDIEVRTSITEASVNSPEELKLMGIKWAQRLNLPAADSAIFMEKNTYVYQILSNFGGAELHLRLVGVPHGSRLDAYLVLSLKGKRQQLQDIVNLQYTVKKALESTGFIPQFSTCIRGIYSVKLSVDQQESRILSIFDSLRASELERLQDETVVSISGYTSAWKPFIKINDEKMNLQVATHRDSQTEATWITVGTPIITAEY